MGREDKPKIKQKWTYTVKGVRYLSTASREVCILTKYIYIIFNKMGGGGRGGGGEREISEEKEKNMVLTPSLPQPVQFPG